ncbi:MAG: alpha-ketoacid dehydrogenase subunit beta, partial [Moorella sp. (in: Bacteria)]|nr:alpha-ketoacid dehydrogenase subunit beta [Moorella sp. (in: firmicutes)]
TILASARKTRRVVIIHEANRRGGAGAELAAVIQEKLFGVLAAPIKRVCAPDVPIPFSPVLEKEYLPDERKLQAAVKELLAG